LDRAAALDKIRYVALGRQFWKMNNAHRCSGSVTSERRLFLCMGSSAVIIVGKNDDAPAFEIAGHLNRQAIPGASEREGRDTQPRQCINILFALWPDQRIPY